MGFLNKIFGEKTPEQKEEKRRNKFINQENKINEILSKYQPEITKDPHKVLYRTGLEKNINNAKTKEEYTVCANQFKQYVLIVLKFFNMDLTTGQEITWTSQTKIDAIGWNSMAPTLIEGFKTLIISDQYEEFISYSDKFFNEFPQIMSKITLIIEPNGIPLSNHLDFSVNEVLLMISFFRAFALYKLNKLEESYQIFKNNPNTEITFEYEDDDYAKTVFDEYSLKISAPYFIDLLENKYNIGSNIDANEVAKEIMEMREEISLIKNNQELVTEIAKKDADPTRRAVAIEAITSQDTLLEIINDPDEDELLRGMAASNINLSEDILKDIIENNENQHVKEMAKLALQFKND